MDTNQIPPSFWVVTSQDFLDKNPGFFEQGKPTPAVIEAAWPRESIAKKMVTKKNRILVELTSMHYRDTRGINQWRLSPGAMVVKIHPPADPPKGFFAFLGRWF